MLSKLMKQCVTIVTTLLIIILKCLIQWTIDVFITSAFHFQHNYDRNGAVLLTWLVVE